MVHKTSKSQQVEEKFIIPAGLSVVDDIFGQKLYSSSKLQRHFLSAIFKQKNLRPVIRSVEKLVTDGKIIPCYASKNVLKLIAHKFFSDPMQKSVLGFFYSTNNKIYCMLDNNTTFFVWVSNKALSSLTIHELMHYCAWNSKSAFIQTHRKSFQKYFYLFYKQYFEVDVSEKQIDKIVDFIFRKFEFSLKTSTSFLVKYANMLDKTLKSNIPDNIRREKLIVKLLAVVKMYLMNPNKFISMVQTGGSTPRKVVIALLNSYRAFGIRSPNTLAIQELIFPSEIICIQSQYSPSSLHYKSIQQVS